MAKIRITPRPMLSQLVYDTADAVLTVNVAGKAAQYDEDECDRLLRVIESSRDPLDDLAEFFQIDFGSMASRAAGAFRLYARQIADQVYVA